MANVKLYKNVYNKDQFKSTVDSALPTDPTPTQSIPSVDEYERWVTERELHEKIHGKHSQS